MPSTADKENTSDSTATETEKLNPEDIIENSTFDQLLEMDDEDDHEFSQSIVLNYFEQAESTFKEMDSALDKKDLPDLSRLGHFLKGSSAALGLKKVKVSCEKMQHYGNLKDENGTTPISKDEALENITSLLKQVKKEYEEAEDYLKKFYGMEK